MSHEGNAIAAFYMWCLHYPWLCQ